MPRIILTFLILGVFSCTSGDRKVNIDHNSGNSSAIVLGPSTRLDSAISSILEAYYKVHGALVEADSSLAHSAAESLVSVTDSLDVKSLGIDSVAATTLEHFRDDISSEAKGLAGEQSLSEQRRALSMITENLFPMLQAVRFKGHTVYEVECPMAFNENEAASWLSPTKEVINPYLGKKHPKYAAGMLHCGGVKDSIYFR